MDRSIAHLISCPFACAARSVTLSLTVWSLSEKLSHEWNIAANETNRSSSTGSHAHAHGYKHASRAPQHARAAYVYLMLKIVTFSPLSGGGGHSLEDERLDGKTRWWSDCTRWFPCKNGTVWMCVQLWRSRRLSGPWGLAAVSQPAWLRLSEVLKKNRPYTRNKLQSLTSNWNCFRHKEWK